MSVSRSDLSDLDFVDAVELAADGSRTSAYRTVSSLVSITSSTKRVVCPASTYLRKDHDKPVEVGDLVTISGASAGNGDYTVAAIVDEDTFDVAETVGANGTGGTASFYYPAGASKVGVDTTAFDNSTASTLQETLQDFDAAITAGGGGGGGITEAEHQTIRQLIHFLEEGPGEGFASGAYKVVTGGLFPTNITWWTSSGMTAKIVEKLITRTGILATEIQWKVYDTDGSTVLASITDTPTYSGIFETSRTRTVSSTSDPSTVTAITHPQLRQLIHFIDEGPADGFAGTLYREVTGNPFPTAVIWWTSAAKTQKIYEVLVTRDGNQFPTTLAHKIYDIDGTTLLYTATDTITYTGVVESSRTRVIT